MKRRFDVDADLTPEELEKLVLENYAQLWEGKEVKKVIVVPKRLVNVVAK